MKLVIRHGLSEANNRHNIGTPAFASPDAPLMPEGLAAAERLGLQLQEQFGITPNTEHIATSQYLRTIQTALTMGAHYNHLRQYTILNELPRQQSGPELRAMLDNGQLPAQALVRAEAILASPPEEDVWVTHGLVIAGLCRTLGVYSNQRAVPRFCEIRELPL